VFVHMYVSLVLNGSLCAENVDFLPDMWLSKPKKCAESVCVLWNHLVDACCGQKTEYLLTETA
jgi:hypothetical protein